MIRFDSSRRRFLQAAALVQAASVGQGALQPHAVSTGEEILPGLGILRGSVNTAVFERNGKKLLIDSGQMASIPGGAEWVLFTHHHPDQASAARHLVAAGAKAVVPAAERRYFEDAQRVWDAADDRLDHDYNCRPDLTTLRDSAPVALAVKGGDVHDWEGLNFEVIETPGHTDGSVTYLVELHGQRVAFTGDLIYGPGQIHDMYSLQKAFAGMNGGYWGFGGAVEDVKASLDRVLERKPSLLIPSHGMVIRDPASAVAQLKQNLDAVMENYLTTCAWRANKAEVNQKNMPALFEPLPPVPYPKWCRDIAYTTKAIVADDKSVFLSDCGSAKVIEELQRLQKSREIGKIEGLWITHYHDDHTEAVNLARHRFGFPVYAQRELVDVLEHPRAYHLPCLFPESIHIDRILQDGETFQWKEFKLTAYFFPGQTLYHAGLLVERDGFKVFFTGDNFSNRSISDVCSQNRNFSGHDVGYEKCLRLLLETKPDILMAAHWGPLPVSYVEKTIAYLQEREKLYAKLFPYDNVNFGLDPYWIRAYPFRQEALPGASVEIGVRVMNHAARAKKVSVALALQEGWKEKRSVAVAEIPARTEGRLGLSAIAPERSDRRRHVLGISAVVDGRPMGESAAAIVDLLGD
jgi:glyoxylase-like metal-dependent hydrolase (beta-lactamase superfamily II)